MMEAAPDSQSERRRPKATAAEVAACQFSSWYSTFRSIANLQRHDDDDDDAWKQGPIPADHTHTEIKRTAHRTNVTIESRILFPLPPDFLDYLTSDGVVLPACARKVSSCMRNDEDILGGEDDDWSEEEGHDDDDDGDANNNNNENGMKTYHFPALTRQIQNAIDELGKGEGVLPKLNWSSPRDASWMNCGTLRCRTPGDVYLLLKSSEFVAFDLEKAWEDLDTNGENDGEEKKGNHHDCESVPNDFRYELVLRKWCNLHPSMEFRCFVYRHELVAISQRHPTKFYKHLQHPSVKQDNNNNDCNINSSSSSDDEHDDSDDEHTHNHKHKHKHEGEHRHIRPTTTTSSSADVTLPLHPIAAQIQKFFRTYVRHRFPNDRHQRSNHDDDDDNPNTSIHKYVMDVYIDTRDRVWIIDFNVWADRTDGLLFSWEELTELADGMTMTMTALSNKMTNGVIGVDATTKKDSSNAYPDPEAIAIPPPEMRVVTRDMKSMTYDPLSTFRGPTDVMDLMGGGATDGERATRFEEFRKLCVKPSEM